MATDQTPANPTSQEGSQNEPVKIEFTPEQQTKVQQLIDAAVGRVSGNVRRESETKVQELERQLTEAKEAAKRAPKGGDNADVSAITAQLEESKNVLASLKGETERYKQLAIEREREAVVARQESLNTRKDVAITSAASKIPFFSLDVVRTLTKDKVEWDADRSAFVVKNDAGQVRLDSSLEKPLSLEAYFTEFAANNKYLVRADVHQGAGSSESSRQNVAANGRYEVADIFGPKSDSRKAADLMKTNKPEYQRLKQLARAGGLIA